MKQELYRCFIAHVLDDVAERRTDDGRYLVRGRRRSVRVKGQARRVFVHGDHICYQGDQFHGSDAEFRLAMAMTAAERLERMQGGDGGSKKAAALSVAGAFRNSACERLKRRFLRPARRKKNDDTDSTIRLAETIRRQANRYRQNHADWEESFERQVALYRSTHFRDQAWIRETEQRWTQWLSEFEQRRQFEWLDAMPVVYLARLYHEQHDFDRARITYHRAISIAGRARMSEELRRVVVEWLHAALEACDKMADRLSDPVFRGPRIAMQESEHSGL